MLIFTACYVIFTLFAFGIIFEGGGSLVVLYRNALLTMLTFHIIVWSGIGICNIIKWKKHYNQDGWQIGIYQPK
jgi:hypothetical protein